MTRIVIPLLALLSVAPAYARDPAVGYVDLARVTNESALGKQNNADQESFHISRQARLDAASAAARKAMGTKDYDARIAEANSLLDRLNKEDHAHRDELAAHLLKEVRAIAKKLAEEKHLDQIDESSHLYSRNDLTDLVIARLDAETFGASERLHAEKEALEKQIAAKESTPPPPDPPKVAAKAK
jgi:Skp family chaperone for outer membrane proteins